MFSREQPESNNIKNNNNNCTNNTNTHWTAWGLSKSLDIKRIEVYNLLKEIVNRSRCWLPSSNHHQVSSSKTICCSYLLALICCSSILLVLLLLLFIVHSAAHSTGQPAMAMSLWPSPALFDHQETSRVKRSPRGSERIESPSISSLAVQVRATGQLQDSRAKPGPLNEQPTFRDGQSANNRGSLPSLPQMETSGSPTTQWIPIVKPQLHNSSLSTTGLSHQSGPLVAPLRLPERPTSGFNQVYNQPRSNRHNERNPIRQHLQPLESYNHHFRHLHTAQHPQHYHHHHHHHHQRRRPRFNYEPAMAAASSSPAPGSGLYRRVLLCDKTLVSLEYVRYDLNPEHRWRRRRRRRPMASVLHMSEPVISGEFELDEFVDDDIDNSIDLEGNYDNSLDAKLPIGRQDQPLNQPNTTTTTTNTSNSTEDNSNPIHRMAHMSSFNQYHQHPHHLLLSEDDPLVRCDMWDLEKGLKNRAPPEFLVRQAVKADFETVREAINRCRQLSERTHVPTGGGGVVDQDDSYRDHSLEIMSTDDLVSLFSMKRGLMPGTKWCGLGDQATTYNDLGPKYRIDICCRAHDHCPIRSKPFRNDYGVLNIGLYTKSHCDCDADFYRCLREVRSRTADLLGNLYFNVMKLQCMREERMKVCREMKPIALLGIERCTKYEDSPIKTVFKFTTPPVAY